jgi:hypothetical protein
VCRSVDPVEAEYLFARAFEELDQRLAEGSLYAGLRCAAILRQMFADQHTLIAQAKRGYSTKLTFSVLHPRPVDYAALGIAPPDLMVMGDQLENTPAPLIRSNLNLDQFLGFKVANYQGAAFSVRDVIKYLADACGGVHLGAPKGDQEVLRELDRVLVEMGVESLRPSAGTIRGIAKVAVDGLRPLYEAIIAKHEPQRRVLSVMGTVRGNLPAEFPGRRGSLMGNLLCTPLDVGSFGAIPPAAFYQWLEVVQSAGEFEKLTKALGYDTHKRFQPSRSDEIPAQLSANFIIPASSTDNAQPRAIVFPRASEKVVLFKLEQDGQLLVAVWWEYERATLHFRVRGLETAIDCSWASGSYSAALFTWEPGRIAVTYATTTESGAYEQRTKASD